MSWSFFSNHLLVLIAISGDEHLTCRQMADRIAVTERTIQLVLKDLEGEKIISRYRVGRANHDMIARDVRVPIADRSVSINALLKLGLSDQLSPATADDDFDLQDWTAGERGIQ